MKTIKYEDRDLWLGARRGKITGTRLKKIYSDDTPKKKDIVEALTEQGVEFKKTDTIPNLLPLLEESKLKELQKGVKKKKAFYELIAERLAIAPDDENPMERGNRLESEAIARFEVMTKKKVNTDLVMWQRDDNESIALSPDGVIGKVEAVEVKCLNSASHIEAYLTKEVPDDYVEQGLQYFIVNDDLKTLYFVLHDPRYPQENIQTFILEIKRKDVQEDIDMYKAYQYEALEQVADIVNELSY